MNKRLYRSNRDVKIAGVCGGIAEYFNMDPTIVRVIALLLIFGGLSPILYLALAIIMPVNPY